MNDKYDDQEKQIDALKTALGGGFNDDVLINNGDIYNKNPKQQREDGNRQKNDQVKLETQARTSSTI